MNPHRTEDFLVQECRRLASYMIDAAPLYSSRDIAEILGADEKWVTALLGVAETGPSPQVIEPSRHGAGETKRPDPPSNQSVFDDQQRATTLSYDGSSSLIGICNPLGEITNMVSDGPPFGLFQRDTPAKERPAK